MSLDTKNTAYDLSIFEDRREHNPKKNNIVKLPKTKSKQKKSFKLLPAFAVILFIGIISIFIYGQVQLSELTDKINSSTKALEESRSVQTQLEMKSASEHSLKDIEAKARNTYNMDTVQPNQVEYINVEENDKVIVNENKKFSLFSFLDDLFS